MKSSLKIYHRPRERAEAVDLLTNGNTRPLSLSTRVPVEGYLDNESVVDLSALGLSYIERDEQALIRIGAQTTLQTIAESPLLRSQAHGLLADAAYLSTHLGMRNLATIGGVLLVPERSPEILLALLVLDAQATVQTHDGPSSGPLKLVPPDNALFVEVAYAQPSSSAGAALDRVARTPRDAAIVAAMALIELDGGRCLRARVALSGCAARPQYIESVGKQLDGKALSMELIESAARETAQQTKPISDYRASAEYRRAMAETLTRRALVAAWRKAGPK